MASFDYDVIVIGSGFGGSVAALRAAEKGYRVGVIRARRRVNGPATAPLRPYEVQEVDVGIRIRA